jgi:hypothetical protein
MKPSFHRSPYFQVDELGDLRRLVLTGEAVKLRPAPNLSELSDIEDFRLRVS